jgi:hypothetical protein
MDEEWVYNAIGKPVKFKYPGDIKKKGILRDRCAIQLESNIACDGSIYTDTIDLIEFVVNGKKFDTIRFGYYRNRRWAGQWTLTEGIEVLKTLFIKTAKEKPWFREFLKEITNEIEFDR